MPVFSRDSCSLHTPCELTASGQCFPAGNQWHRALEPCLECFNGSDDSPFQSNHTPRAPRLHLGRGACLDLWVAGVSVGRATTRCYGRRVVHLQGVLSSGRHLDWHDLGGQGGRNDPADLGRALCGRKPQGGGASPTRFNPVGFCVCDFQDWKRVELRRPQLPHGAVAGVDRRNSSGQHGSQGHSDALRHRRNPRSHVHLWGRTWAAAARPCRHLGHRAGSGHGGGHSQRDHGLRHSVEFRSRVGRGSRSQVASVLGDLRRRPETCGGHGGSDGPWLSGRRGESGCHTETLFGLQHALEWKRQNAGVHP